MSIALDLLLLGTGWAHVLLAPYTKVEESFNLHATHDVLMYGVRPDALPNYDHFVFPGAVPRTFIGSVLLAWLSTPAISLAHWFDLVNDKSDLQTVVRLVLATLNAVTLCLLRRAVSRRFGGSSSFFFTALTCTQFHLPFWMGRTLPNMFALIPVNLSLYLFINRRPNALRPSPSNVRGCIALLVFTAAVFRSEVLLLLGPFALQALICGHVSFLTLLSVGLTSGLASAAATVGVDSYFWQRWPLWPELYGLYFNVIEGKSSEWGVSPFGTYFTSSLPKLLLSSLPLSVVGLLVDPRTQGHMVPSLLFVLLISNLGHKEWRFVIYVVPAFNVAAARAASWLTSRRRRSLFRSFCFLSLFCLLAGNCIATYFFAMTAMANYPGGEALQRFNEIYEARDNVHVHISNLAAQTGASLFLQSHSPPYLAGLDIAPPTQYWTYNKTEHLSPKSLTAAREITHLIAESGTASAFTSWITTDPWTNVETVDGYDGLVLNRSLWGFTKGRLVDSFDALRHPLAIVKSKKLVILERADLQDV